MEGFKRVVPDMPERILKQFEEDSAHFRESQKKALQGDLDFDTRSQWMAFAIIVSIVALQHKIVSIVRNRLRVN